MGVPCGCSEEPWGLFLAHLLHLAQTGMVRLGHRWSPAGNTDWDGNSVERTLRWQQSLLDCHVSRPRKNTENDPNTALWEQQAPCHCPQHQPSAVTVTRQGQEYRAVDWLLHQLPICPVCLAEQCPRERAQGVAAPISIGKGQSNSSSMGSPRRHIAV